MPLAMVTQHVCAFGQQTLDLSGSTCDDRRSNSRSYPEGTKAEGLRSPIGCAILRQSASSGARWHGRSALFPRTASFENVGVRSDRSGWSINR